MLTLFIQFLYAQKSLFSAKNFFTPPSVRLQNNLELLGLEKPSSLTLVLRFREKLELWTMIHLTLNLEIWSWSRKKPLILLFQLRFWYVTFTQKWTWLKRVKLKAKEFKINEKIERYRVEAFKTLQSSWRKLILCLNSKALKFSDSLVF